MYLFAHSKDALYTRSRKLKEDRIGPLQIKAVLDRSHFLLRNWAW